MSSGPKKLNISEMWKLYRLLKDGVSNPLGTDLFENVRYIFSHVSSQYLKSAFHVMYGNDVSFKTSKDFLVLFSNGLVGCKFFDFYKAMENFDVH